MDSSEIDEALLQALRELAALDPAETPDKAEELAAELTRRLEDEEDG